MELHASLGHVPRRTRKTTREVHVPQKLLFMYALRALLDCPYFLQIPECTSNIFLKDLKFDYKKKLPTYL